MQSPDAGEWAQALAAVIEESHLVPAERLTDTVDRVLRPLGLGVQVLMIDLAQRGLHLVPTTDETDETDETAVPIPVEGTMAGRCYQLTEIVAATDETGTRLLWLPLVDGTERVGIMRVTVSAQVTDGHALRRWLWSLAGLVGHVLMTKLGHNTRLQQIRAPQLQPASELLWQLLPPRTLATEQVVISALLEPVDQVAGDAYDYAVGEAIDLAVFDGVGHDVAAGVSTALALTAIRNARRAGITDLSTQAERADAMLAAHDRPDRFVTAALARLDTATGDLAYLLAGHPPPLLLRNGRMVKELTAAPRLPLGLALSDSTPAIVVHEQLEPGDRVLLYTDGVTEARDEHGEFFGEQRLIDMAERAELDQLSAPETLRRLATAVMAHQGDRLQDDATLLLLDWASDRHPRLFPSLLYPS